MRFQSRAVNRRAKIGRMFEWLSPTLAFILLGLKLIGLIGAFVGFSPEKPSSEISASTAAPRSKYRQIIAVAFLSVAIGAELVDGLLKQLDSREQSARFERLAHPLGTIRLTAFYSISFSGQGLEDYKHRLDETHGLARPDPQRDKLAYTLYTSAPTVFININQESTAQRLDRERSANSGKKTAKDEDTDWESEGSEGSEDDISFYMDAPESLAIEKIVEERHYNYSNGVIHATLGPIANRPDDRTSTGRIISTEDLLGSRLEVLFCPDRALQVETTGLAVTVEAIDIEFPGRRRLLLNTAEARHGWKPATLARTCSMLTFMVPKSRQDWERITRQ